MDAVAPLHRLQGQQGRAAEQALRGLRPAHELAQGLAKTWEQVRYCSEACRKGSGKGKTP